jgi:hypothetical protein
MFAVPIIDLATTDVTNRSIQLGQRGAIRRALGPSRSWRHHGAQIFILHGPVGPGEVRDVEVRTVGIDAHPFDGGELTSWFATRATFYRRVN